MKSQTDHLDSIVEPARPVHASATPGLETLSAVCSGAQEVFYEENGRETA